MSSLVAGLQGLQAKIAEQATPRVLAGIAMLIAILVFLALEDLADRVSQKRAEVEDLRREQRLHSALLGDDDWVERAATAEAALELTRERFWNGATTGIVAARLQGSVEASARAAELQQPRVAVLPNPSPLGESARLFEISLNARDRQGQFLSFFQDLGRADGFLIPVAFEWDKINGSLLVRLEAPATLEPNTADSAGTAQ